VPPSSREPRRQAPPALRRLGLDLAALAAERGGPLSVLTNTPFYLTSQLLFKLLGSLEQIDEVVLSMQAEVADKLLAPPRCKDYGILSVMTQLFGQPERLFEIPPHAFRRAAHRTPSLPARSRDTASAASPNRPEPKCSAAVLRLRPVGAPPGSALPLSAAQRSQLLGLLKLAFEQRLGSGLGLGLGLAGCSSSPSSRGAARETSHERHAVPPSPPLRPPAALSLEREVSLPWPGERCSASPSSRCWPPPKSRRPRRCCA